MGARSVGDRVDAELLLEQLVTTAGDPRPGLRRGAESQDRVGQRVRIAGRAQPCGVGVGEHLARRRRVAGDDRARAAASASNTLFGMTRCALPDVPKIPRHTWLAAIRLGSSS